MHSNLFRGKTRDKGKWIEGSYLHLNVGYDYICDGSVWIGTLTPYKQEVLSETIGQYTGLTDKNDKKIYEGDILQYGDKRFVVWWNDEAFQWQAKERLAVTSTYDGMSRNVVWDNIDLGWIAAEIHYTGHMTTEVIGNIHDNPELLNNYFNCSTTERSRENDKEEF